MNSSWKCQSSSSKVQMFMTLQTWVDYKDITHLEIVLEGTCMKKAEERTEYLKIAWVSLSDSNVLSSLPTFEGIRVIKIGYTKAVKTKPSLWNSIGSLSPRKMTWSV